MKCPHCGPALQPSQMGRVVDSRPHRYGIRRRRECPKCSERFTTFEEVWDKYDAELEKLESQMLPGLSLLQSVSADHWRT